MRRTAISCLLAATFMTSQPALAQKAPVVGMPITPDMLLPGQGIPAGEYRLRARDAGLCLGELPAAGFEKAHLGLFAEDCSPDPAAIQRPSPPPRSRFDRSKVSIVPLGNGSFAVWKTYYCLTLARGVLIGARRADFERCGTPGRNSATEFIRLPNDQRFVLGNYNDGQGFSLRSMDASFRDCLVLRDGSRAAGADIINWRCDGSQGQRYDLIYLGPLWGDLEREYRSAMAYYGERNPTPATTPGASGTVVMTADPGAMLGVLSKSGAKPAARPDLAGSVNTGALRQARLFPDKGPAPVGIPAPLSLDMGVPVTDRAIDLTDRWDRWRLEVPYRFAVEGVKAVSAECEVRDVGGQILGERSVIQQIDGPSAGMLSIGIPATSDIAGQAATADCKVALSGERAGTDWEAWTFPENGAPNGWAVWVREAGKSRWWTGAGFRQDYSMHFAVSLPQN